MRIPCESQRGVVLACSSWSASKHATARSSSLPRSRLKCLPAACMTGAAAPSSSSFSFLPFSLGLPLSSFSFLSFFLPVLALVFLPCAPSGASGNCLQATHKPASAYFCVHKPTTCAPSLLQGKRQPNFLPRTFGPNREQVQSSENKRQLQQMMVQVRSYDAVPTTMLSCTKGLISEQSTVNTALLNVL